MIEEVLRYRTRVEADVMMTNNCTSRLETMTLEIFSIIDV